MFCRAESASSRDRNISFYEAEEGIPATFLAHHFQGSHLNPRLPFFCPLHSPTNFFVIRTPIDAPRRRTPSRPNNLDLETDLFRIYAAQLRFR